MTERWQKELRKLRTVEPGGDGWERAETRAPSGDGLPPPRQRLTAAVVAFAVFAAAGLFLVRSFDRGQEGDLGASKGLGGSHLVVTATSAQDEDAFGAITLMVDGAGVPGIGGTAGTWPVGDGDEHPIGYPTQRLDQADFVDVTAGATLEITGDADSVETMAYVGDDPEGAETMSIDPSTLSTLVPGYYVLRVEASWATPTTETWSSKLFPIEIVEAPADGAISTLAGTEWRLTTVDGQPIDEDGDRLVGASIEFKENMFGGWSGCNSFGGRYRTDDSSFSVDGIGGTLVGPCSGEEAWFARLGSADSWTSDGSTLTVSGPAGSFIAVRVGMEPVDVLRVECLPGSTQVLDRQVVVTAQGVAGIFGPAGHAKRVEFVPVAASAADETTESLGDEVTATTVPLTPGDWEVRCAGWSEEIRPVEITVVPDASGSASPTPTASQEPSDTLHVSCTDGGAVVSTPLVAVQADGVHVVVDEAGGFGELVLDPLDDFPLQFSSGSSGVAGEFARELVPGRWRAGCVVGPEQDRSSVVGWAEFDVVDPHSLWVSTALACGVGEPIDSVENGGTISKVDDETPQEAIARVLALRASDLVEEAGYEGSFRQAYRIVREGEVVAWLLFSDWAPEWWRLTAGWACPGEGFDTEAGR